MISVTQRKNITRMGEYSTVSDFITDYLLAIGEKFESPVDHVALGDFISKYVDTESLGKDLIADGDFEAEYHSRGVRISVPESSALLQNAINNM